MKVIHRLATQPKTGQFGTTKARRPATALTIGNFDGIHRGHSALLQHVSMTAKEKGLIPTVITLEPHPKELFNPTFKLPRISCLRDRLALMKMCGIEQVCILPFNWQLAKLSPNEFIQNILVDQLNAKQLWVGDDFRFGANREGDYKLLCNMAETFNFQVEHILEVQNQGQRISSSLIRQALLHGNVKDAVQWLGHPLTYSGHVLHGKKLGRTLGFPTLNLHFKAGCSALTGVLAVWVHGLEETPLPGVASMGKRPTVEESDVTLLETFLPKWQGDAYGKLITVEVIEHLRHEEKFADLSLMQKTMHQDTEQALSILKKKPAMLNYSTYQFTT